MNKHELLMDLWVVRKSEIIEEICGGCESCVGLSEASCTPIK